MLLGMILFWLCFGSIVILITFGVGLNEMVKNGRKPHNLGEYHD